MDLEEAYRLLDGAIVILENPEDYDTIEDPQFDSLPPTWVTHVIGLLKKAQEELGSAHRPCPHKVENQIFWKGPCPFCEAEEKRR